jgi:mannose-6-phosphate isomerase-like protein (cupin superfamily)
LPLLKGKNAESKYVNITGCMQHFYKIEPMNDICILCRVTKKADSDEKNEWQHHSHPNIEEYTFVISGKVQAVMGENFEEKYDLEAGDLLITPRGVPHKILGGDAELLFFHTKTNAFGHTVQDRHPFLAYDSQAREKKEDKENLPKIGEYMESDPLERGWKEENL